jgi:hypothetical protein
LDIFSTLRTKSGARKLKKLIDEQEVDSNFYRNILTVKLTLGFSFEEVYDMTLKEFNFQLHHAHQRLLMQQNMISYAVGKGMGTIKD